MKKTTIYLCAGILAFALTACGGQEDGDGSQSTEPTDTTEEIQNTAEPSQGSSDETLGEDGTDSGSDVQAPDDGMEESSGSGEEGGWSQEMSGFKAAVVTALGEDNYWPNMPLDAELFEMQFGIGEELYEDYLAEMPMIGTNKDTLVIVRAKEDTVDEVEQLLTARRDSEAADTMQYPMNLGKVQAGLVEKIGNYVIYVMLGADTIDMETEDAIVHCKEVNQQAIDAIREKIES